MDLNDLPVTPSTREALQASFANYQRHARLRLSVDSYVNGVTGQFAFCTAEQIESPAHVLPFTSEEILERAERVFTDLTLEGITPLISVHTQDGVLKKHRILERKDGMTLVLRTEEPRALFAFAKGLGSRTLAMEDASKPETPLMAKAAAWLKREPYRNSSD